MNAGMAHNSNAVADDHAGADWLLPRRRHPYYIVAPRYVRMSAGIKVLHLLCHALNRAGERAYLITHPYCLPQYATHPELITPVLTRATLEHDFASGLAPIVVYPETVHGNPFNAPFVVRYVLNFPGLLGGDFQYDEDEFCIAYSENLAGSIPSARLTLFVPASDPQTFSPVPEQERRGTCFYAGKYKYHHGGELFDITRDSTEITRDLPDSPTQPQIADLFRRSELLYCYENSALAIEALLCGCPVVFLPNPYFDRVIAAEELGWDGIAWGTDPDEIARAKHTVHLARDNFLHHFDVFYEALGEFIASTQSEADGRRYETPIAVPYLRDTNLVLKIGGVLEIVRSFYQQKGGLKTAGQVLKRISQRGLRFFP
ncbi:hypothetical protein Tbd_1883 [Thiobacillus denitrificans ATCC 25259]|uniref:Uncharacterized protein n=2 Tax=Thiobacillus denitrificans TaxID=36861 RepID=Q3SHQ0_THIDA|nr:hypothetical protein Tbd_1883 [Thiobacillus denitrificans ATCC 25259]